MLARVTDEAVQVHGGMGLMSDLPLARFWRDARVERIWDGTSEIQRHIIGRDLLRPPWLMSDLAWNNFFPTWVPRRRAGIRYGPPARQADALSVDSGSLGVL